LRGDAAKREFIAVWLRNGRVPAGMAVNVWDLGDAVPALVRSGVMVDPARLKDRKVELKDLVDIEPLQR
jgi:3-phenylpropionate/trans-cinnamate dioxygenase ferredoxin reductase subunit